MSTNDPKRYDPWLGFAQDQMDPNTPFSFTDPETGVTYHGKVGDVHLTSGGFGGFGDSIVTEPADLHYATRAHVKEDPDG